MKSAKLIFTSLFILCTTTIVYAVPYGHAIAFQAEHKVLLIENLAQGNIIDYCIYISPEAKPAMEEARADKDVKAAFKLWTEYTAAFIKDEGRAEEFGSLYKNLERGARLNKLKSCNPYKRSQEELIAKTDETSPADISFLFLTPQQTEKVCGKGAAGCRYKKTIISKIADKAPLYVFEAIDKHEIVRPTQEELIKYPDIKNGSRIYYEYFERWQDSLAIVAHELGHAFGLGDQYDNGPFYTSFAYRTPQTRLSLMRMATFISCDDMDGLITLIDRVQGKHRTFASLCNDGLTIKDGIAMDNNIFGYGYAQNNKKSDKISDAPASLKRQQDNIKIHNLKKALQDAQKKNFLKKWGSFDFK